MAGAGCVSLNQDHLPEPRLAAFKAANVRLNETKKSPKPGRRPPV
jgi:hypothetical protein